MQNKNGFVNSTSSRIPIFEYSCSQFSVRKSSVFRALMAFDGGSHRSTAVGLAKLMRPRS
jgi:hypothetical protein